MKCLILAGPPRSGETSRLGSMAGGRKGSNAGRMVARKARQSRGQEPAQGSSSQPESASGVLVGALQIVG
jgi:hypothetical protein